jgi:microcystin degradation protein MlrC
MKIASGGIQHETNTFSVTPTTLDDFIRDSNCGPELDGGDVIFDRYRNTAAVHGGYIAGAEAAGIELVPVMCVRAQPSGAVQQAALDKMLNTLCERFKATLPVDGILLDLHGAMVSDEHEDAESYIIGAVRELVGDDVPIVVTLDLHANITQRMADLSDVIIGFDTYPHVDMHERGVEAVELMARIVNGEVQAVQKFRQLPLVTMPPMQCTLREPMQSLIAQMHAMEQEPNVLTATLAMGFPFADIHDAGVSVLVTVDGDADLANSKADELAGWIWNLRDQLQPDLKTIEYVIEFAQDSSNEGLILFADGSDNPGGGAPCDGTVALQALIDADLQGTAVGVLFDPETVAQAVAAGVGNSFEATIGAKTDARHGESIKALAYVKAICDGQFTHQGPMLRGVNDQMGMTATLVVEDVEVVVSSQRRQCLDMQMLRAAGIEPSQKRLIVLKSAVHFRAHFGPLANHIFDADTPGVHRPDFAGFDYRKLRRPIYPLDEGCAN